MKNMHCFLKMCLKNTCCLILQVERERIEDSSWVLVAAGPQWQGATD